jgi:hypothetical protein
MLFCQHFPLFVFPPICLIVCLPVHPSVCLHLSNSICLPIHLSICLSTHSIHLFILLSSHPFICLSSCLFIQSFVPLSDHLSVHLCWYTPTGLSFHLNILSVFLFIQFVSLSIQRFVFLFLKVLKSVGNMSL